MNKSDKLQELQNRLQELKNKNEKTLNSIFTLSPENINNSLVQLQEAKAKLKIKSQIFIGISYESKWSKREKTIKDAIINCGFNPILAKTIVNPSNLTIDEKIKKTMANSEFGIFDISYVNNCHPNLGALYECAYMEGKEKQVIMICKKSDQKKLHSDLRNKEILFFTNLKELKINLEKRIKELWKKR